MKLYKDTAYMTVGEAISLIAKMQPGLYPEARVIAYDRGFAVQYRISGPYWPELEFDNDYKR